MTIAEEIGRPFSLVNWIYWFKATEEARAVDQGSGGTNTIEIAYLLTWSHTPIRAVFDLTYGTFIARSPITQLNQDTLSNHIANLQGFQSLCENFKTEWKLQHPEAPCPQ